MGKMEEGGCICFVTLLYKHVSHFIYYYKQKKEKKENGSPPSDGRRKRVPITVVDESSDEESEEEGKKEGEGRRAGEEGKDDRSKGKEGGKRREGRRWRKENGEAKVGGQRDSSEDARADEVTDSSKDSTASSSPPVLRLVWELQFCVFVCMCVRVHIDTVCWFLNVLHFRPRTSLCTGGIPFHVQHGARTMPNSWNSFHSNSSQKVSADENKM